MIARLVSIRLSSFDALLAALLVVTLGIIGYFILTANPDSHRAYTASLLEFSVADSRLTEELYRLGSGEMTHFDALVGMEQALRRSKHRIDRLPAHVAESTAVHDALLAVTTQMNQKLAPLESFKTSLAVLLVRVDNLPQHVEVAHEGTGNGPTVDRLRLQLLQYLAEPSPARREALAAQLDGLVPPRGDGEDGQPDADPLETFGRYVEEILVLHGEVRRGLASIAGVRLDDAVAALTYAYHRAHQQNRLGAAGLMSAVMAGMIIFFVVLTYLTRQRTMQKERAIADKQESLSSALTEARTRNATLQEDRALEAANLAENRLDALLRHTFETIAVISRENNFIFVSPAVARMLGLADRELIGRSVFEGIHAEDLIRVKDYLTRAEKELQTERTITYRLMDAHGKWHLVETFASNQYSNPAVRGMVLNTRRLDDTPGPT